MQVFEIKTNKSDYPYIVIADGFKKAVEILYDKGIYDSNIISVNYKENYKSDHILIEECLTSKSEIEKKVRRELQDAMPHWKSMINGIAGCVDRELYLVRTSRGHYFTSKCIGGFSGDSYYLELDSLEQLSGLPKDKQ